MAKTRINTAASFTIDLAAILALVVLLFAGRDYCEQSYLVVESGSGKPIAGATVSCMIVYPHSSFASVIQLDRLLGYEGRLGHIYRARTDCSGKATVKMRADYWLLQRWETAVAEGYRSPTAARETPLPPGAGTVFILEKSE